MGIAIVVTLGPSAPGKHGCTLTNRKRDGSIRFLELCRADERAHVRIPERVADTERRSRRHVAFRESFEHVPMHQNALGRCADLTAVRMPRRDNRRDCDIEVGVFPYDRGRLPAEFQRNPGQVCRRAGHHGLAGIAVSGERDERSQRVIDKSLPGRSVAGDEVDDAGREIQLDPGDPLLVGTGVLEAELDVVREAGHVLGQVRGSGTAGQRGAAAHALRMASRRPRPRPP